MIETQENDLVVQYQGKSSLNGSKTSLNHERYLLESSLGVA